MLQGQPNFDLPAEPLQNRDVSGVIKQTGIAYPRRKFAYLVFLEKVAIFSRICSDGFDCDLGSLVVVSLATTDHAL